MGELLIISSKTIVGRGGKEDRAPNLEKELKNLMIAALETPESLGGESWP